jgi:hypothetical protein
MIKGEFMKQLFITIAIILSMFCSSLGFDTIKTIDGKVYNGTIIDTGTILVTLDAREDNKVISKNSISEISNDNGTTDEILLPKNVAPTTSEVKIAKFAAIEREIIDTEYKMNQATESIYAGPIAAVLIDAGIAYLVKPNDSNASLGVSVVEYTVALVGTIISGTGFLQYWDGVNTAGQLRAKKYDLMFYPYLNPEKFANNTNDTNDTLGIAIKLKI